jgi:alpha-amylase
MVVDVALYTLVHQPRRLKLPAQPIPRYASIEDITRCLFDERLNEYYFRQVTQASYYPAARVLLELTRKQGLRLALGFSLSFVRQAERWEPALLDLFRELAAEEGVELVGVDPYHSLHCLIDLPGFAVRMGWMADEIETLFGKRPSVTDTTEMCMSASIYDALDAAGFRGAFIDSNPRTMQWRSSNYLYRYGAEQPYPFDIKPPTRTRRTTKSRERDRQGPPYTAETLSEDGLLLLPRHQDLSADVGQRFSNNAWSGYPLYADAYARWIAQAEGDFVLLNWDFENFGERHTHATGIFEFIQALPNELERHGASMRTPGELIDRYAGARVYHLPLPLHPPVWSEMLGLESSAGYEPQRETFQLLRDVYDLARLTENPDLLDIAVWLAQADTFRLVQGARNRYASAATPQEWWRLGPAEMLREQKQVYLNVLGALEPYLPARLLRQARKQPVVASKPARRKSSPEKAKPASAVRQK